MLEMDEGESWTIPGTNSSLRELDFHLTVGTYSDALLLGFIMDEESGPFALIHSRGNVSDRPLFFQQRMKSWLSSSFMMTDQCICPV